jgi:hypothetical protein
MMYEVRKAANCSKHVTHSQSMFFDAATWRRISFEFIGNRRAVYLPNYVVILSHAMISYGHPVVACLQYAWLTKDLCWNQGLYYAGLVSGAIAIAWSFGLCGRALYYRSISESVTVTAQRM